MQSAQHPYASNNSYTAAKPSQGFESAFAGMALEHAPSHGAELPPPSGFEERVNMLSAGSAGLQSPHTSTLVCVQDTAWRFSVIAMQEGSILSQIQLKLLAVSLKQHKGVSEAQCTEHLYPDLLYKHVIPA